MRPPNVNLITYFVTTAGVYTSTIITKMFVPMYNNSENINN